MHSAETYTYRVMWSHEDSEYVATVAEFPSLSWLDASQGAALEGIVSLVREVLADMASNGEAAPEPFGCRTYSGRFQVRIPPEQHRRIAVEAAEAGVSINRLVASRL